MKIADYLWQNIIIDFIIKLLKSENHNIDVKYNSILIIINKLIKYAHFISYIELFKVK